MTFKQGDIVLVWFPESNLEIAKKRPAIVLQADGLDTGIDQIIIGMVTSNLSRKGHPSRIFVEINSDSGKKTGLISDSVIMTDNISTVITRAIYRKIGGFDDIESLRDATAHTFGLKR